VKNHLMTVSEEAHVPHGTNTKGSNKIMNIHSTTGRQDRSDKGFTLVEILIAIVLVGILSAVAVVGISNLVSKGSSSACGASLDAAKAGSAVYFADLSTYPSTLALLADGTHLSLPTNVTVNTTAVTAASPRPAAAIGMQASGAGWYLTMTTAGTLTAAPVFACN
jgi:prepilin-type N-terminal cleavage/methylation domain-containing protein